MHKFISASHNLNHELSMYPISATLYQINGSGHENNVSHNYNVSLFGYNVMHITNYYTLRTTSYYQLQGLGVVVFVVAGYSPYSWSLCCCGVVCSIPHLVITFCPRGCTLQQFRALRIFVVLWYLVIAK